MKIRKDRQIKMSKFLKIYIITFSSIIGVILLALVFLWLYMADYEKSIPDNLMKPMVSDIGNKKFDKLLTGIKGNEFTSENDLKAYLESLITGEEIKFSRSPVADENKFVYTIKTSKKDIATVTIKKSNKKTAFGNDKYEVENVESSLLSTDKLIITAPADAVVSVNGIKAPEKYIVKKDIAVKEIELVPDTANKPTLVNYEIPGVIPGAKITAKGKLGNDLTPIKDEKTGEISFSFEGPPEDGKQYDKLVTDISQAFAKYVTNDASFSQVGKYLSKDSPIYEMISRMESYWYTPHDKYEFKNVKTSEYKYYSENCFSYRIQFDHYVYRIQANYTRHEQCDYTFVFAKKGNDWIVYDMIFNNNSNNPQVETST